MKTALVNIFSCYFVQNISIFSLVNFLDNARTNAAEGFIKESNILFKSFGLIEKLIDISCFIAAARSFIHLAPLLTKIRQHLFLSIEGRRGSIRTSFISLVASCCLAAREKCYTSLMTCFSLMLEHSLSLT